MFIRIFLLVFLCLQYASANLIITDSIDKYTDFSISYFFDETNTLNIEDMPTKNFTQKIQSQFTLGYAEKDVWFKIEIKNRSRTNDFVLYFTEPFWDKFDLYEKVKDTYVKQEAGLLTALNKRKIEDASPSFPLSINKGETKTLYINGHSVNGYLGAFELYTSKEFFRPSRITLNTFYLFYSGVFFIIILLNFFLLVEMRERIYAYYIGYVGAYIVFISMFSGSYLHLGFSGWNHGLHTTGAVVLMFMSLFSNSFLELDKHFPKADRVFRLFTFIFIIFALLMGFNIPYFTLIFNIFSCIFVMSLFLMAIKTCQLNKITTQYYLYALIIYMPTMGIMVLTFNSFVINNDITRYSFLAGSLIEIIFFSLILVSKFHIAKYDKIRLQKELLAIKQKNEDYLEQEIEKQRNELKKQNQQLLIQSRMAQMGEMISMIAHQWRQPLNNISLIVMDIQMKINFEQLKLEADAKTYILNHINDVNMYTQNLSTTIDDFRNFYKPNKKSDTIKLEEICTKSLAIVKSSLINNNVNVIEEYNSDETLEVYTNEMIQVVLNILKNAEDNFLEKDIKEAYIKITTNDKVISICDNGGGISDDIIDKIFDPYFSTKDEKNGTGLGLYMSKRIVEEHHKAKLKVENTDDGVCFKIELA